MTKSSWVAALVLVCALATPVVAQDRPVAGRIKVSTGSAFIVRDGAQIPAQVGQVVYEADGLRTGADGKVGLTLNDDTRLSLGPSSELKLAPDSIRLETPAAIIGVRGTTLAISVLPE